ncbi:hypothetical protein HCC18_07150 [Listeria booriae]|uniref:hypothetical protein n=1 Tax=Listeria booriae TaxID=1552123 RepID=UPI001625DF5F|nr:hypothetical protein [Listeria booriae]MBC2316617.1 hypothetical protein [Listeria booriae]
MNMNQIQLTQSQFYIHSPNGGFVATYTIQNEKINISFGNQNLSLAYTFDHPQLKIYNAILTDNNEVYLIVDGFSETETLAILFLSETACACDIVGHGLTDFKVIDGQAYLLYHEEGIFHENSDNALNGYSGHVLLKWNPAENKMEQVLPDGFLELIVDANSFCADEKGDLYIFYYGDFEEESGKFCLKYQMQTKQGEFYPVSEYYDASFYQNNHLFAWDGKGIAEFNEQLERLDYSLIDTEDYTGVSVAYHEMVFMKRDSCHVYRQLA